MIYQVRQWDDNFENHKSREYEDCRFVCVPNKHDGLGFSRVMAEPDGVAIYGVWVLILAICSRQGRPRLGWLTEDGTREGVPLTPEDIEGQVGCSLEQITRAIAFLSSSRIGWLGAYPTLDEAPKTLVNKGRKGGRKKGGLPPANRLSTTLEEKRIEEKRTEDAESVYELYPKKVGKPAAIKAIIKAIKDGADPETLRDKAKQYAETVKGDNPDFIPHPSTWFNQARYNDAPETWRKSGNGTGATAKPQPVQTQWL